jgi:cytochrome b6-f complex iron-sulfur subunit
MGTEHDDDRSTVSGISRRSLLAAGAIGLPGLALVACSASSGGATGSSLPKLSDIKVSHIKVGEAVVAQGADGKPIAVARPTESSIAAFTAICTHQGCTVASAGQQLDCPCHGSVYNATTGAVVRGPAPLPLSPVKVTVSGDHVVAG